MSCLPDRPATTTRYRVGRQFHHGRKKPKVVGGVDTHADTLHVAVLTMLGRKLADKEFHTDPGGYWDAIRFMTGHGRVQSVIGVEGTSSYGAGLTRA